MNDLSFFPKNRVFFKTFGCRTNIYDTQVMIENLKDFEVVDNEGNANIVVINSCTVTNGADTSVRSYISKLNRDGKKVIIAGCGALSKGEKLFNENRVFGVMGHSEKENINELLQENNPFLKLGDLTSIDKTVVSNYQDRTKAFIKIQEGCNFSCSYCIIPSARGKARSQNEEKILEQTTKLASNGYGEIILTGTNIGSYGRDVNSSLGALLQKIGKIKGIKRVRLGSIEPIQIDASFREILNESWLERHLHIALQHTNEEMLKIMRRRNSVKKDLDLFHELSSLGFALGTDFIVGHPGESDEIWEDALSSLIKLPLTHIHAFCYSPRQNTHSATLKNTVNGDIAKNRLKEIITIVENKNYNFRKNINIPLKVLVEKKKNGFHGGFDQFYNKIIIDCDKNIEKEWIEIVNFEPMKDANYAKI